MDRCPRFFVNLRYMANKIYFIRHAPTKANLSGSMVKNYDAFDIEQFDTALWYKNIGSRIKISDNFEIWVSPTLRCKSTAMKLFGSLESKMREEPLLKELDCSSLGTKKFWEISKEEFDSICKPDLEAFRNQIDSLIKKLKEKDKPIICITHGLFTRYLYNYLTDQGDSELYDLINSKTFQFKNLDMMECTYDEDIKVNGVFHFDEYQ